MALRERNRVKRITASGGGTLVAPNHESFLVKDIYCVPSAHDDYLTILVEGVNVAKYRVKGLAGNHLPYPCVKTTQLYEATRGTIISQLRAAGLDLSIPVPSGQTLTVSRYAEAGDVCLVYDAYDRDDIAEDAPNGPRARIRRYLHYVTNSAAITSSPVTLDQSLIWTGGDAWPIGGLDVPHNTIIRVVGLVGCPVAKGDGSNNKGYCQYLKLLKEGDVLMSDDQVGIPFLGDSSVTAATAAYTPVASVIGPATAERPYPAMIFPEPLEFTTGQTLTLQVTVGNAAASGIAAGEIDLALIIEREITG